MRGSVTHRTSQGRGARGNPGNQTQSSRPGGTPGQLPLSPWTLAYTSAHTKSPSLKQQPAGTGPGSRKKDGNLQGTRYITEELVLKLSRQENPGLLRSLDFSSKSAQKHIKFIEGLEKCERLQVLNLSHNAIEKMERLERLTKLRELHLSHNHIQKLEGLKQLVLLQHLDMSHNCMSHLPVWLPCRLPALHTLLLHHNHLSSLHEFSKLRSLSSLSELTVSGNPVSLLPHSRLFLVYHLRALDRLDNLPITPQEREQAQQRFNTEEVDRLEKELQSKVSEMERLQTDKEAAETQLDQQVALCFSLKQHSTQLQHSLSELEQELYTKNSLLKQRSVELTRACEKHYELEQELAFCKIDAKFDPLPFYPQKQEVEYVECCHDESPYIGKAHQLRRKAVLPSSSSPLQLQPPDLYGTGTETEREQETEQTALQQLIRQRQGAEEQILGARAELRQPEEAVALKRMSEVEKEALRQRLHSKVMKLKQLRGETEALDGEMDRTREKRRQTEGEKEQLLALLNSLQPADPRHTHVTAQLANKNQLLDMMSKKHCELEGRLDEMLTRIATETEEIKELEQQLTVGQIQANEVLQGELQEVIRGLLEYLGGVKEQARRARDRAQQLEAENQVLQRQLQDAHTHCSTQETAAQEEGSRREAEMFDLQRKNEDLREAQGQISAYEAELEDQLQQHHNHNQQLQDELTRLKKNSQNERLSRETALSQLQETITQLKADKAELEQGRAFMSSPLELRVRVEELAVCLTSGHTLFRSAGPADTLGLTLEALQTRLLQHQNQQDQQRHWEQERLGLELDCLRQQLARSEHSQKGEGQQQLDRELQELRKNISQADQQLVHTSETLRALHSTVEEIAEERAQEQEEKEGFRTQAAEACSELNRALAYIRQLQNQLEDNDQPDASTRVIQHTHTLQAMEPKHSLQCEQSSRSSRVCAVGRQFCVPAASQAASLASQDTQDSGLSSQQPPSLDRGTHRPPSPDRGTHRPPSTGGNWLYTPTGDTHTQRAPWRESGGASDADCSSAGGGGGKPLPSPAPGLHPGLAAGCGPLPPGCQLYRPPGVVLSPMMEVYPGPWEKQKDPLRLELKHLRHTLRQQHRHREESVSKEVLCVERTLMKRRAELREADRRLLEAQTCLSHTRHKSRAVQQQLSDTHRELQKLERTAKDSATLLLEAEQQRSAVQEELGGLGRRREEEQSRLLEGRRRSEEQSRGLREVEEVLRSREQEIHAAMDRLEELRQEKASLLCVCKEAEKVLAERRLDLGTLSSLLRHKAAGIAFGLENPNIKKRRTFSMQSGVR